MTPKHILLPLNGESDGESVALAGLRIAQHYGAHVSAGYEDALGPLYAPTLGYMPSGPVFGEFYDQMQKLRTERMATARGQFDAAVAATKIPIVSEVACSRGSAMWMEPADSGTLSQRGLVIDLAVVPAPGENLSPGPWAAIDNLLFAAGAPVLMLPRGASNVEFRRPLIAWNGSREAVRALQCLVAFLPQGARPVLLQVGKLGVGRVPASHAVDYLGWHCFESDVRLIEGKDSNAPAIFQEQAVDLEASAMVMGAYTHGRTRQLLLGGLTNAMLRHAALPTLMSH